jgi:hypothetical protein
LFNDCDTSRMRECSEEFGFESTERVLHGLTIYEYSSIRI